LPVKNLQHQVLPAEAGRVDALVARLLDFSRSKVRGLIDHDGVSVNGDPCTDPGQKVEAGDQLALTYDLARRYKEKPVERATRGFTLVYSDDHLAVVDKSPGILTVPTTRRETNTLIDLLSTRLAKGQPRRKKAIVVHRLDRDTSGLLVFGRTPEVAGRLIAQFAAKKPKREYAAIVAGVLEQNEGTFRSLLATDEDLNQHSVKEGTRASESAKLAVTHDQVKDRYKDDTLVAVNLETGRRNQIRVHFAEHGHPVLGDVRYEVERAKHKAWPYKRLALHARILGFVHPVGGKKLRFESPLPREFEVFARQGRT
jgi:23S rRNA pseudouridine1911/1915/1917 synthase